MKERVRFGAYLFEVATARVWSGGREVRLTPKAAAVLKELVTHAGSPVSKDDLFAAVWDGTAVTDDALTSCIQELRRALDDDARQPRFIETRHRRGYQFVAPIADQQPEGIADDRLPAPEMTTIAVLPFADMSPGRDHEYFCDGLAEELINVLAHVDGLRVAARTASFQFCGGGADVRDVGRQLSVGTVLEGSVRRSENRVRITVQLIDAATGYHRWSQRFDRTLDDVFALQDEVASCVAASLRRNVLGRFERPVRLRPQAGSVAVQGTACADGTTLPGPRSGVWPKAFGRRKI